ncbi:MULTISPECIES: hypothetical protein [Moorena]|uniref:hypothetical protein n=1 Tax=Moorena TaxID=1155738 RepID=UPI00117F4FF8|nr:MULTISPECIES: hypothetical protein [Moorena]NEO24646.1 hypothetical protein [Moorena sp. SIO4A5]
MANTDERLAVVAILDSVRDSHIYGDFGFLGNSWALPMHQQTQNPIQAKIASLLYAGYFAVTIIKMS